MLSQSIDDDILWAEFAFYFAMSTKSEYADEVIGKLQKVNTKIAAGEPLFTNSPEYYQGINHLILNEADITLPRFVRDRS